MSAVSPFRCWLAGSFVLPQHGPTILRLNWQSAVAGESRHAQPANSYLGRGHGAEKPVGEIDQLTPLSHGRVQARARAGAFWL